VIKRIDGMIRILLLGAVFCCAYAVIEGLSVIVGSEHAAVYIYLYPGLLLSGYLAAFLCRKPAVPILRIIVFTAICLLSLFVWRLVIVNSNSLFGSINTGTSAFTAQEMAKGVLYLCLGSFVYFDVPAVERLGLLWPGLVPMTGVLLLTELFSKLQILKSQLMILAFLFILFAILRQWLIQAYTIFTSRGVELPEVRKRMILTGLVTSICLFLLIIFVVNLKGLLWSLVCLLMSWLDALMRFILWLLGLLFRSRESSKSPEGFGFLPFDPRPSAYPWVVFLQYFCGCFAALSAIYWIILKTSSALKKLFHKILGWLSRLFTSEAGSPAPDDTEFFDTVEVCEKNKTRQPVMKKTTLPALLKQLKEESDPALLIRICYRIFMVKLYDGDVELADTDTTEEILIKARSTMSGGNTGTHIESLTHLYDRTRYGEQVPSAAEADEAREEWGHH